MEPVIKNKYTISHTVNALLSPLILSLANNLSPIAFGTLFKTASRFADEENKLWLIRSSTNVFRGRSPRVRLVTCIKKTITKIAGKKLIQNLIINHGVLGAKEREQNERKTWNK